MVMSWIGHENFQKWPDAQQAFLAEIRSFLALLNVKLSFENPGGYSFPMTYL